MKRSGSINSGFDGMEDWLLNPLLCLSVYGSDGGVMR